MPDREKLICPHCDNVIATIPEDREITDDLVCSNCGATVRPPDALDKAANKIKDAVEKAGEQIRKALSPD